MQSYTRAIEIAPSDVGYVLLARVLEQSGQHQQAESVLRAAKASSRNFEEARRAADHLLAR